MDYTPAAAAATLSYHKNEWMYEWTNKQTNGWLNEWTDEQKAKWLNEWLSDINLINS